LEIAIAVVVAVAVVAVAPPSSFVEGGAALLVFLLTPKYLSGFL
jgi:hypothetical protein